VTSFAGQKLCEECPSTEMKYSVLHSERVEYNSKDIFVIKLHEMNYDYMKNKFSMILVGISIA
jgi:hypothetical protein